MHQNLCIAVVRHKLVPQVLEFFAEFAVVVDAAVEDDGDRIVRRDRGERLVIYGIIRLAMKNHRQRQALI